MASLRTHNNRRRNTIEKKSFWTNSRWWRKYRDRKRRAFLKSWHVAEPSLRVGMYVEDCRYHPCVITKVRMLDNVDVDVDIQVASCVNGTTNSCSWKHCGPYALSEAEAFERRDFILQHGMLCHNCKYVYGPDITPVLVAEAVEQERVWSFSSNASVAFLTDAGRQWLKDEYGIDATIFEQGF